MAKFKLTDKHIAFANSIASGVEQWKAYVDHIATSKKIKKQTAFVNSSKLMAKSAMIELVEKCRAERQDAVSKASARVLAKEFSTAILLVEEMDAYHSAIIQGLVEVEEVIPVYRWTDQIGKDGKVINRIREASFVKVKRPPNIREKQISIDALYKRNGNYAPSRVYGAFRNYPDEPGDEQNIARVILLSNGEKINLP